MSREEALASLRNAIAAFKDEDGVVKLRGVDIQGSGAVLTRPKLLQAYIQPILDARSPDDAAAAIASVQKSLMGLQIFQDVLVSIGTDSVVSLQLPAAKRFIAQTGTKFGQSEGSGYFRGSIRNGLGFGEVMSIDTSTGTRTRSSHLLDVAVPLPFTRAIGWRAEFLGYSSEKIVDWASHRAHIHGFTTRFQNQDQGFGIDAVLRTIRGTRMKPSEALREAAGHSFKLSCFYNWQMDTRPAVNRFMATNGIRVKVRNELALPVSDFPFIKSSADFHRGFKVWKQITGSLGGKLGVLVPLGPQNTSHIFDRFNLGGALDMRGFRLNHVGPHDGIDALGGNALAATGVSLFAPVPRIDNPNLRLHAFGNAGAVDSSLRALVNSYPSVSAGFGIAYSHPSARFELSIAMPLVAHKREQTHKGLQFGVGLEFL